MNYTLVCRECGGTVETKVEYEWLVVSYSVLLVPRGMGNQSR